MKVLTYKWHIDVITPFSKLLVRLHSNNTLHFLPPGVDFTNVFRARFLRRFSYKRVFSSYVLLCARITSVKNVGEIDPSCDVTFWFSKKAGQNTKLWLKFWKKCHVTFGDTIPYPPWVSLIICKNGPLLFLPSHLFYKMHCKKIRERRQRTKSLRARDELLLISSIA